MDPVQSLAILSLGAFVTVLVTAAFYAFSVRPRLLEPVDLEVMPLLDERWQAELAEQRDAVEQLNAALARHAAALRAAGVPASGSGDSGDLFAVLRRQSEAIERVSVALEQQAGHLAALDDRLATQAQTLAQVDALRQAVPDLADKLTEQSRLLALVTVRREAAPGDATRDAAEPLVVAADVGLAAAVQQQADQLDTIAGWLDRWTTDNQRRATQLAEHARVLAELDAELSAQTAAHARLEDKVDEHTAMLVTAATERREQAGRLERVLSQLGEMVPLLKKWSSQSASRVRMTGRLTDIKGIGPVYAGKLYEAGIHTFKQLAALTPEEIHTIMNEPKWRARGIDAASWIEQATRFASQAEKVEKLS